MVVMYFVLGMVIMLLIETMFEKIMKRFKDIKEVTEVEEKKIKIIKDREEGFQNVMNYDYDVALGNRRSGD